MTITYSILGMTCAHCERAIKSGLAAIPGVQSVDVDLKSKLVTVGGVNLDDVALRAAIDEAGYEAT